MNTFLDGVQWLFEPAHWSGYDGIPVRVWEHVKLSLIALLVASAIAIPLGLIVGHTRRGAFVTTQIANLGASVVALRRGEPIPEEGYHGDYVKELADSVPGWQRASSYHSTFPGVLVRGQIQAVQFLHDGVSLFDPFVNVASVSRVQPMELIKRVEMITGPGGVLWGSNSLLGILNVITKDAEDVDGVELGAQVGDGGGDRLMARA